MAKNHAPSLLFSVIIHVLAGLIVYATYQAVASFTKKEKKETLFCVSLSTYEAPKVKKKKIIEEKIVRKIPPKKKLQKKKTQKKRKKIVHRKIIKKLEPKIVEKIVLAKKATTELPTIVPITMPKTVQKEILVTQETNTSTKIQKVSPQKEYIDKHLEKIQKLLQDNLYYPRRARKRGIVGTVVVHFEIAIDGEVTKVETLSSPHEVLSRAAIKTINDLSGKFPKPSEKLLLKIPIAYRLN